MTDVVTYQAHITHNNPKVSPWLGYIVLPDGSLWGVRFEGDSEEAVRAKAIALYESEKTKQQRLYGNAPMDTLQSNEDVNEVKSTSGRGQHLISTVCMIHHAMKKRIRCAAAEVSKFEADGWVKGGPRTQFEG